MSDEAKPTMPYWHVDTDADGVSREARFEPTAFAFEGIHPKVAPQWNDKQEPSKAAVTFTVLPVGWVGDWHENPKPQWIAILSGRWFVETMDGTRIEMGLGELMMGEDQNTKEREGKKGHVSGTVGDVPCTMIVTGLGVEPTVVRPGRFKSLAANPIDAASVRDPHGVLASGFGLRKSMVPLWNCQKISTLTIAA